MLKKLIDGRQPAPDNPPKANLPAVWREPPPPAVDEGRSKFVGPAKRAVTVMLASFNAGPAQGESDMVARIEGLAMVCADYPNEVVERAARSLLTNNPNNPFPPTCQDLHARCRELWGSWRDQAWAWMVGYREINPWKTRPCSPELLDSIIMEVIEVGEFRHESDFGTPGRWKVHRSPLRWCPGNGWHVNDECFPRWDKFLRAAGRYDEIVELREQAKAEHLASLARLEKLWEEQRRRDEENLKARELERKKELEEQRKRRQEFRAKAGNRHDAQVDIPF